MRKLFWISIMGLCSASSSAVAGNLSQLESQSKEILSSVKQAQAEIQGQEKFHRQVLGSLYQINKRIKSLADDRAQLSSRTFAAERDVQQSARRIAQLESQIEIQRGQMSKRLRALYLLSGEGGFRAYFASMDSHDLDQTTKYLKLFADKDYQVIRSYQSNLKILEANRQKLRGQVERLVKLQKNSESQERALMAEQKSKVKLLEKLRQARHEHVTRLKELKQVARGVLEEEDAQALLRPSLFESRGRLIAPVRAPIKRKFGFIQDELYKFRLSHKGLFFSAGLGAEIQSIFRGTVAFAGKLPYMGKALVIDHGDQYYSVYTHGKELLVKRGDTVVEGQVIARTGFHPEEQEAGLYFELRHFSDAIDPQSWFKGRDLLTKN